MVLFSLIVPTRNEAPHIIDVCNKIIYILDKNLTSFEIIVVDDSNDTTWQLLKSLAEIDGRIKLIRRENKAGLASAIIAGWSSAEGGILGVIDADLQHSPDILPTILNCLIEHKDVDIAIASRNISGASTIGWGTYRMFISRLATATTRIFIPGIVGSIADPLSGFFMFRKEIISDIKLQPIGYKILLEVLAKGKYRKVCEIPYIFQARKSGKSKAGCKQFLISFFHIIRLYLFYKIKKQPIRIIYNGRIPRGR
jgi:dolichol-phosphate mannosyltransferase